MLLLFLLLFCTKIVDGAKPEGMEDWNYWGAHDERYWERTYRTCRGLHQSPINIERRHLVHRGDMQLELINFDLPFERMVLLNTGHGVKLMPNASSFQAFVGGTAVEGDIFRFLELHWHWRNAHARGSEHAIDGEKFTMEMHLVFQNVKYDRPLNESETLSLVRTYPDAFLVLAVFFNESSIQEHTTLGTIANHFDRITNNDADRVCINSSIRLIDLLPARRETFFIYSGSYTTPSCDEVVTWVLFPQFLPVSPGQMNLFHRLLGVNNKLLNQADNENIGYFRHIHELGTRQVFSSQINSEAHQLVPTLAIVLYFVHFLGLEP